MPTTSEGKVGGVLMTRDVRLTVNEYAWLAVCVSASVSVTVNAKTPNACELPKITPAVERVSPAGRPPDVIAQL
jgi:hypothetical protein